MLRTLLHVSIVMAVLVGSVMIAIARGQTPVEVAYVASPESSVPQQHVTKPDRRQEDADADPAWMAVVVPAEEITVAAPAQARIEQVHVRLGDPVSRGQVLVSIDRRQVEKDLAAARASLGALQARRREASIELEQAEDQRERTHSLGEFVSEQEQRQVQLRARAATARVERAHGDVAEQRAEIAKLQQLLVDAEVRAPFDGMVALRHADAGAFLAEGAPLLELVSTHRLLRLAVPAGRGVPAVEAGLRVRCGGAADTVGAVVERVAPEIEVASGMVLVEARLEGQVDARALQIGQACEAWATASSPMPASETR